LPVRERVLVRERVGDETRPATGAWPLRCYF